MNNSPVCTYKFDGKDVPKKKYNTAEEAHSAAQKKNEQPNSIHKLGEYKCLTCLRFHIGKTKNFSIKIILYFTNNNHITI